MYQPIWSVQWWKNASQEMYQASQEAKQGQDTGAATDQGDGEGGSDSADDVTDVEFEEVDDKK